MLTASGPWKIAVKRMPTNPVEKATGSPINMTKTMLPKIRMVIHSMLI